MSSDHIDRAHQNVNNFAGNDRAVAKVPRTHCQRIGVKITAIANRGVITDTAKVSSVTPDPLASNNAATVQTNVQK